MQRSRLTPSFLLSGHPSFIGEKDGDRMFFHYYDRRRSGFATLGDLPLRWTDDGWPRI